MGTRWATSLWIAASTLLGWSLFDHVPYADLDRSWALGLHLAHLDDVGFGSDLVFNYGPLGFVARPVAGTGWVYAVAVLATAALTVLCAVLVFSTLGTIGLGFHRRGAATAVVMLVAPAENLLVELVLVLGAVWLVTHLRRRGPPSNGWLVTAGAVLATLTLIKVSVGPPGAVTLLAVAASCGRRGLAAVLGASIGSFVALWVVTGQRIGDLGDWLVGARDIAAGHVPAMNLDDPSRRWEYVAVAVLLVCVGAVVADGRVRARLRSLDRAALVTVVVAVVLGWFVIRQGFTRHGARTRLVFFAIAWMTTAWTPWHRLTPTRRRPAVLAVAASAVAYFVAAGSLVRVVDPLTPIDDAIASARLLTSPGYRETELDAARSAAQAAYAVPESMVTTIGGAPVSIDPTEIGVTWAYDLTWAPMPTMQRYLGYTDDLDRRNAEHLAGPDAPPFVLRQGFAVIDGRYAPAESPRYQRALLCEYEVVEASEGWELLRKTAPRCGTPREIARVVLRAGERVRVPTPTDGHALLVSIEVDRSIADRVATLLLKPTSNPHVEIDDERYRIIPATSSIPALLTVPDGAGWGASTGLVESPETLRLDTGGSVSFFEMRVGSGSNGEV